jgi:hypothetical protein
VVGERHEVSEATVNRFLSLTCSLPLLVLGVSGCDIGFDGTNPDLNLGPSIMVGEDLSVGHPGAVLDAEEENSQDPVCASSAPLECGASVSASTAESTAQSEIDSYSCGDWDASGPEVIFSFTAPESGAFTARLVETALNTDLDVYVLGEEGAGCDPSNCISYGNQEATWEAEADSTYYVVVDGFLGDSGQFTLELQCAVVDDAPAPDPDPEPEPEEGESCSATSSLVCGSTIAADTTASSATDDIDSYSCVAWDASGPEVMYSFTATSTGTVTAALTLIETGQDLDIYVLDQSCTSDSCVAYGNVSADFEAIAGETYYFVVDGYYGDAGEYELEVSCAGPGIAADANGFATCDSDLSDDTSVGSSSIAGYGCNFWDASGPELVYSLTVDSAGEVTATLSNLGGQDLDIYIIPDSGDGLDPSACEAYGNSSASWTAEEGESFYVVVDGFLGASGSFDLEVSCSAPGADSTHCLDWSTVNFSEPSAFGTLLTNFGVDLTASSILLSASEINSNSGNLQMTMGSSQVGTCAQDLSVSTNDLTSLQAGAYAGGTYDIGPVTSSIRMGTWDYPIYDLEVEGEFNLDGTVIADASFVGELDVSDLHWQACMFALNCYPCSQGNGQCIDFAMDSAELFETGAGPLQSVQ